MANVLCVSHEWNLGFDDLRELANAGMRVVTTASGFGAIRTFAERRVDAVVVNRRLPDIEIDDLVAFFRHHDEGIPIVMLSTIMPLPSTPPHVDAVIHKHGCGSLLASTLEVLLASRTPKPAAVEGDDTLPQAA